MTGVGGDEDDHEGEDEGAPESFADLIGGARPLKGAKPLAPPPPSRAAKRAPKRARKEAATAHRFRWPDPTNRRLAGAAGISDRRLFDLGRGVPEPEERIDLHGVRERAASGLLTKRLESAVSRGLRCVVVVHGRGARSGTGEAVLRDRLPDWLTGSAAARSVLGFAPAPARLGGEGATLVLLRRR